MTFIVGPRILSPNMSLRERLRQLKAEEVELQRSQPIRSGLTSQEKYKQAEVKIGEELDKLALEASSLLLPFLDVVNEEKFGGKGFVHIVKKSPDRFVHWSDAREEEVPWVTVAISFGLGKLPLEEYCNYSNIDGWMLSLTLDRDRNVQVRPGSTQYGPDSSPRFVVNIRDEEAKQKIEDEIFRLLADPTDPCSWEGEGDFIKVDRAND